MNKNEIIEQQFKFIDDIDTFQDVAKSDDKLFRKLVEDRLKKHLKETPIHSEDGQTLNTDQIYKECVFDNFKNGLCDIIVTNTVTNYTFCLPDYKIDNIAMMVNDDKFVFFGIPKYIGDSDSVTIFQKD